MAAKMEKTKTPGVYKRGNRYVEVWTYRGRQHKKSHRTYAEARESKAGRVAGDRRPETRQHFEDYFEDWIETYTGRTAGGLSETSRVEYRRSIESFAVPTWRGWRLSEIATSDVKGLLSQMRRKGESTSQIRKVRAAVAVLFATAAEDGLIAANPAHGVAIPAASTPEPESTRRKALSEEELDLLLDALPEDWQPFFEFLAETGLRISEALGLKWKHLHLDRTGPKVTVREQFYRGKRRRLKTENGRRDVPLSEGTRDLLLTLRPAGGDPEAAVFATRTGRPHNPSNIRSRILDPAAVSLGFYVEVPRQNGEGVRKRSTITFHTFRHTCASMLSDRGRNAAEIAAYLGHSDSAFTQRTYIHPLGDGPGAPLSLGRRGKGGKRVAIEHPETAGNPETVETPETVR